MRFSHQITTVKCYCTVEIKSKNIYKNAVRITVIVGYHYFSIIIFQLYRQMYLWSLSMTLGRLVVFSGFLHQLNWPTGYNWDIVESDVKHHKLKSNLYLWRRLLTCSTSRTNLILYRTHMDTKSSRNRNIKFKCW